MNSRIWSVLISLCVHFFCHWSGAIREERSPVSKGFLPYKTVTSIREYCTCLTPYRCSCCQVVTLLYSKSQKNLCINFVYQGNGILIDATLNLSNIKSRKVTDYRPLKFCINVPGCVFSSTCVNVVELNQFPRSITACLRLDIYTKKRIWQINYDCVSISTAPPVVTSTTKMMNATTTKMMNATTSGSSGTTKMTTKMTMSSGQTTMSSRPTMMTTSMTTTTMKATTMTTMIPPKVETEETTSDVEIITIPGTGSTTVIDID